ncbi:LysR family transcriptional regulator [Alcaligenes faecalis]|jgi:DNA-binding transcriptional LysR family regulator|uniref:LysR family transcriptional regulator n=1 Tax=Alcaligenes faecalis TaxID=511 RepID=A0A2U2BNM0_ALCFA|nr:LysR family transcriptional regulator [Alcaligenes faecalis]ALO37260.1 LysR family transcriptional regulator [Alcaligenes faecalis]KAA1288665.1 LysR family transcriptional regulator [Alcaligenes faecalis]MBW4787999.1 LysR family transcriptional regulator [Alcaligenes faecalis subsp. faecalis]MBY6308910.1 LysR family transcriptional regulator [Alcaligenes faecalis]MBY6316721.1 LysR family transcriptional regulator [Alcaligenes faecalis]
MYDLNDMVLFTEVVQRGGFSAAARHLGMPPSRVSRRLSRLEAEVGVRLLQRTTRSLSLTPAGEVFLRHCQAMRDEAEAAYAAVAQVQQEPRGLLRISCPVTLAHTVLSTVFAQFLIRYPQVELEVEVSNRVVDPVADGIDVALRVRSTLSDSASYIVKRLGETGAILVAQPELLARFDPVRGPADLVKLPTVAMSARQGQNEWELYGPEGASLTVTHRPRYMASDLLTLREGVEQGIGVGILPDYMCCDALKAGRLVQVLPQWAPLPGIIHAVFASRRGMAPAVRHFLDYLGEQLPVHHPQI